MFLLLFLLDGRRIRIRISDCWIREARKHMNPTDPASDQDQQHCLERSKTARKRKKKNLILQIRNHASFLRQLRVLKHGLHVLKIYSNDAVGVRYHLTYIPR
jgi:hypothetical protein